MSSQPFKTLSGSTTTLLFSLLVLFLCPQQSLAGPWKSGDTTVQFKNWYPQFGYVFRDILAKNCTEEYANYLTAVKDDGRIDWQGGGDHPSALTQPVIQCLLDHTTDYIKSAMSSAQVLLGVTPTILAILGSSYTELALLNVVARRPMLSCLLALGSPSVYMSRAFEHTDPVTLLQDRRGRLRQHAWTGWRLQLLTVAEYMVVLAAIANVATINWHLSIRTRTDLSKTASNNEAQRSNSIPEKMLKKLCRVLSNWTRTEFQSSCCQKSIHVTASRERPVLIVLSWILSTLIVGHVIYGTIVYSSLYFIGPRDALAVVGRLMASVLACRVVCMFEIAGLRENIKDIILECDVPDDRLRYWPMVAQLGIGEQEKDAVAVSVREV